MKQFVLSILTVVSLSVTSFAGDMTMSSKDYKAPMADPCFAAQELQLDVFASFNAAHDGSDYDDGFGGGIALNYFCSQYIGFGVEGNVYDGDRAGVWTTTARIIARYPFEGSLCWAPYIFAGGGVRMDGTTVGVVDVGGGVEFRLTHKLGLFGEGRYSFGAAGEDQSQARLGVRFVF